jgi:protein-histidine pros-kinase
MELFVEEFSLRKAIGEVSSIVSPIVKKKNLNFNVDVASDVDVVKLDQQKLKQVLYNLLSNAAKFTDERGTIEIHAQRLNTNFVQVKVRDTGIGIKREDLGKLFIEFQQLDQGADRQYQGTGLGLALTKRIVELLKGKIEVESVLGKGSIFTVILPRNLEEAR